MIPPFNHNHVLPPFVGESSAKGVISPYKSDIMELCKRFATSPQRIEILKGFVQFRIKCFDTGIRKGFQWIDGSFIEDVMTRDNREPNDIDVASFVYLEGNVYLADNIKRKFPESLDSGLSKLAFNVDHYLIVVDETPEATINMVKYWNQLFSHNRLGVWKGMVEIPLCEKDNTADTEALYYLNTL